MDVVIHRHHQDDGNQEFSKSLEGCEATDFKEKKIHNDKSVAIVNLSPSTINYYHDFCYCSSWFFTWAAAAKTFHLSYKENAIESAEEEVKCK